MSEIFEQISSLDSLSMMCTEEPEQLDTSWEILENTRRALKDLSKLDEDEDRKLSEIHSRHLAILKRLLGIKDLSDIRFTMMKRAQSGTFKKVLTVNEPSRQLDQGKGLTSGKTKMYAEWQARPYQVELSGGRFCKRASNGRPRPFSTLGMESHGKAHFGAFVLDLKRRLYVFNHLDKSDHVAHSTFVRGGPVLAAGEIRILDGRLMAITSHSGHYRPDADAIHDTLSYFQSQGISLVGAVTFFVVDPKVGLQPLSGKNLPWVLLSSVATFSIVKELANDEKDLHTEEGLDLLKKRTLEQELSSKFVYGAAAFVKAVRKAREKARQELEEFFQ